MIAIYALFVWSQWQVQVIMNMSMERGDLEQTALQMILKLISTVKCSFLMNSLLKKLRRIDRFINAVSMVSIIFLNFFYFNSENNWKIQKGSSSAIIFVLFLCNRERFIMLRFLQSVEIIWNCQSMILIFKWWAPFKQQQQNWFLCTRTYNFFFFFSLCFRFSLPSCLFFSDLYHYFYFSSC